MGPELAYAMGPQPGGGGGGSSMWSFLPIILIFIFIIIIVYFLLIRPRQNPKIKEAVMKVKKCKSCNRDLQSLEEVVTEYCHACEKAGRVLTTDTKKKDELGEEALMLEIAESNNERARFKKQAEIRGREAAHTKKCPYCAEEILAEAIKCKHCGSMLVSNQSLQQTERYYDRSIINPSNPPKDPVSMALLSGCCIAGLGQIVLGQKIKGIVILLGSMVLAAITMGMSILVTWPLGGIDAYPIAKKLKSGRTVGEWEFF